MQLGKCRVCKKQRFTYLESLQVVVLEDESEETGEGCKHHLGDVAQLIVLQVQNAKTHQAIEAFLRYLAKR